MEPLWLAVLLAHPLGCPEWRVAVLGCALLARFGTQVYLCHSSGLPEVAEYWNQVVHCDSRLSLATTHN